MVSEQHGYNLFLLSEVIKTFFCCFCTWLLVFFFACFLTNRLHDPGVARASIEFLYKEMILTGHCKSAREKITVGCFYATNLPFKLFLVSLEVFHHKIFASFYVQNIETKEMTCLPLKCPFNSYMKPQADDNSLHNGCESGLSLRAPPCMYDQNSPSAIPHHTS